VTVGASDALKSIAKNLESILQSLKSTVIMPAGEAFMFTGIDTDANGTLYSHVTYAQGAEGADQKK
jgi:20S proteasome alpha/beta subunit